MLILLFLISFPYGEVIVDMDVIGIEEVDTALVLNSAGLRIGEVLTREKGINTIKNLHTIGLFKDIKLNAERKGAGIKVIIEIEENPRLKSILFRGNKKVRDGDLSSLVDLAPPALLSEYKIFKIRNKILKLYEEKGMSGTLISISQEEMEDGVQVIFDIEEGEKYKVKEIGFSGNRGLSDHILSSVLSNKTKPWWMFWRNTDLKVDSVKTDIYKIEALYRKKGYLDVQVDSFNISYEDNKAMIVYSVNEGRLYYFGRYNFDYEEGFKDISSRIHWRAGDVYNEEEVNKTIMEFYNYYTDNGFLYASIVPLYSVRDDSLIDITIHIDKGSPVYIRYIDISGNAKTYDKVVRRNLTIYPGELFQREKIINSQRNLYRLGYFEDLGLSFEHSEDADSVNILIEVMERQAGQFNAGFGFSQSYGLTGNIGANIPNLLGTGQTISFSYERTIRAGEHNDIIQNVNLSYLQPWLFDTPTSIGFNLYRVYRRWTYFGEEKTGGSFSLGRILTADRYLKATGTYKLERTELEILDEGVSDYIKSQAGTRYESAISGELLHDSRDSRIAASVGNYYSISSKYAGGILGGDRNYWKIILEARRYQSIYGDLILMNRARIGYAHSPDGEPPLTERFFLGGIGFWGLRGYDEREISPYSGFYATGGSFAVVNNLELRYNFSRTSYGMIFLDAGNCFRDIQEARLSDLFYGVGVGFRLEIPMMGLFGIDLGYGLDEEKGREWKPHFQIGISY